MQYEKKQREQNKDLVQVARRKPCLSATAAQGNGSRRVRWDKAEEVQELLPRAFFGPVTVSSVYTAHLAAARSERQPHQEPEAQSLLG